MYLKKLSVQGFKSFANRTQFEFGRGVTSVVGPNGSGKSNVADAIRWVLGEQSIRLLRAKKQEDVIFSGTKDRAAVGMAEAILTLDNEDRWLPVDFSEVEVGRRVYRNGESEYLLNGSRVRLRDIIDLLMKGDVGQNSYAIMGQGLVDEVLSMSPDDRRSFLDEAADVKRFRSRIQEAQTRLAATRENMDRVVLLTNEIEPRLAQLSRQAERAADHARLSAELRDLLRAYYGHRWSEAQNALARARGSLDQVTAEDVAAEARVTQLREQIRTLGEEIRKRRDAIARRDTRQTETEQRVTLIEQNTALDRERHAMISARSEEVRLELEVLETEKLNLTSTEVDEGRRGLEVVEEAEEAKALARQTREALEFAEREYSTLRSRVQDLRDTGNMAERRASAHRGDIDSARRRLAELDRHAEQLVARRKQALVELIGYGRRFAELQAQLVEAERQLEAARRAAEDARGRLSRVQQEVRAYEAASNEDLRQLHHLEGRLDALRRVEVEHDAVASGTRSVLIMGQALIEGIEPGSLGEPPEVEGILGLLSRQIKVPPGLELAINAALEQRLHSVLVESEEQAFKAIELLQQRRHGRAQFLALESVRHVYPLNLQKERGVVGVAAKLVRCEARLRPLVDTLLGRVIIVEDRATASRMIRRSLGSVVTVDGLFIEQSGVVTGGATGSEESAFRRQQELEELPRLISELRERTSVSTQQLENAHHAIEQLSTLAQEEEADYNDLRRHLEKVRVEVSRERDRLLRIRRELGSIHGRRDDIEKDRATALDLIAQAEAALASLQSHGDEDTAAITAAEEDLRAATERREAALRAVADASARVATVEGERRTIEAMREQHEKAIERLANQISARRLQARNLELEAGVIEERLRKHSAELETVRLEQARSSDDAAPDRDELHRLENHERQVQEEFAESQASLLQAERRRLDIEAEVARLLDQLDSMRVEMEREGLAPDRTGNIVGIDEAMVASPLFGDAVQQSPRIQGGALIDVDETRSRIEEVRRQIRRLGPINAEAPEDYRESQERYEFLTTQMRDLEDAQIQLRQAIAELNEEIRVRFGATFEKVNTAFGEYFSSFFGGGQAQLLLTNPENIAEAGVEIEAQPPGKRLNSLTLLSGGERSLTAVALLFALLSANPAPFCVLDEVDAALDEANVGRFTQALARLAEKTQFIVVTHNRRTIEIADAIYGVSMGRDGVSKVLSLKLSDLPQN
ncbi:MAG TPA: chromosome segregation protein SMC [Tepidiformaceae bacterium]